MISLLYISQDEVQKEEKRLCRLLNQTQVEVPHFGRTIHIYIQGLIQIYKRATWQRLQLTGMASLADLAWIVQKHTKKQK